MLPYSLERRALLRHRKLLLPSTLLHSVVHSITVLNGEITSHNHSNVFFCRLQYTALVSHHDWTKRFFDCQNINCLGNSTLTGVLWPTAFHRQQDNYTHCTRYSLNFFLYDHISKTCMDKSHRKSCYQKRCGFKIFMGDA